MQSPSNLYVNTNPSSSGQYAYNNNGYNSGYSYATSNPSASSASTSASTLTSPNKSKSNSKMTFSQRMKNYDFQPSVPSEFRVYTTHGAILSLTTIFLLLYLTYTEYNFNLTYTTREKVHVMNVDHHTTDHDQSSSTSRFFLNNHNYKATGDDDDDYNNRQSIEQHRIEMEVDITFPSIACPLLSVDAVDPNNQRQSLHLDNTHRIWKHRIQVNKDTGKVGYIGKRSKFELGMTLQSEGHIEEYAAEKKMKFVKDVVSERKRALKLEAAEAAKRNGNARPHLPPSHPARKGQTDELYDDEIDDFAKTLNLDGDDQEMNFCGSCYGAGDAGECCNTCDDVKRAYQRKGWIFEPNLDVQQCHNELKGDDLAGEGCNVHGFVSLSPGGGNLHITPGHELENFGKTFHFQDLQDLIKQTFETFDVSHTVEKLRFGRGYPGDIHQLDGAKRNVTDSYGMYQYYFQIVPTEYRFLNGTVIKTNQYSVIEHMRHVQPGSKRGLPGVYFFYEVSPLHVQIEEYRHGWIRFFTSVAAVVGGVFSAMRMMDAYIFSKSGSRRTLSPF